VHGTLDDRRSAEAGLPAWGGTAHHAVTPAVPGRPLTALDLGVTRPDCTYDVVVVWDGRFFRLEAHLDRFAASLAWLRLDPGYDRGQIEAVRHGHVRHAGMRLPPGPRDAPGPTRRARRDYRAWRTP
jgi:hypothetical protein